MSPAQCPLDTYETQNRDERRFFSGDLERLWVQKQLCVGQQESFLLNAEQGEGERSLSSGTDCSVAAAFGLQMLQPHFGGFGSPELFWCGGGGGSW